MNANKTSKAVKYMKFRGFSLVNEIVGIWEKYNSFTSSEAADLAKEALAFDPLSQEGL